MLMRLWVWRKIVWRGGRALKALLLCEALALALFTRDEVLPQRWQDLLHLSAIPSLSIWQWTTLAPALFALFILEGAYQFAKELGADEQFKQSRVREEPQPGILDSISAGKRAAREIGRGAQRLAKKGSSFGPKMIDYGQQFAKAGEDVPSLTRIASRVTRDVNRYAEALEGETRALNVEVQKFVANYEVYVSGLQPGPQTDEKRRVIRGVNEVSRSAVEGWTRYKESVQNLEKLNIYQPLTTAAKRLRLAQDGVIKVFTDTEVATGRMLNVMARAGTS